MANYRDSQKISFSKTEENRFRQLFNDWAKSIKGYNRNRLGEQLKIVEVWDTPIYRGLLKTQYDSRTLENTYERVGGRKFPPKTISSESQINRWSFNIYPNSFANNDKSFPVPGSQYITACHTCSATGKVTCNKCGGKGTIERAVKYTKTCETCGGGGKLYDGTYTTQELEYYNSPEGVKTRYVTKTHTRHKTCYRCNGSGKVEDIKYVTETCPTCSGSGRVTCPTCIGDRELVRFWKLNCSHYYKTHVDYCFPSQIPSDEVPKIIKLFDNSTPWRVVEKLNIDKENFDKNDLASRPIVGSMLSRLPNRIDHPSNTVVCFNLLEACECEAKTVVYEVDRKRYTCLLLGSDWKLITVTSPVSDHMDDLKDKVNRYCSMRRFGKAWSVLQKVNKFPQAGSKEARMQTQLEERMALMSRLGGNLAIVLCVIFLSPLLFALYEAEFYAVWTSWMIEKFDTTTIGLMLVSIIYVMYFGMKSCKNNLPKFAYQVASPLSRFVRGFLVGMSNFIYFASIAIILTFVGITPLICKLLYLAFAIVMMIVLLIAGLVQRVF